MTTELFCNARKERPVFLHDKTDGIIFSHPLQHNDSMPSGGGEMPGSGAPFYHLGTTKKDQNPFPAQGFYPTRAGRQCTVY